MLFFVEGYIGKTPYMGEDETINHRGLIEATDYEAACEKYRKHWEDKTAEYDVYYRVLNFDLTETII
jgi:hypothetical protein